MTAIPNETINILCFLIWGFVLNLYLQRLSLIIGFDIPIFDIKKSSSG